MGSDRYHPDVLTRDSQRRRQLLDVFLGGLAAVDPYRAVSDAINRTDDSLSFAGRRVDLGDFDRSVVIAFGKASVPMARAAVSRLHGLRYLGVVVSNDPSPVAGLEVHRAIHPVPAESNLVATRRVIELAQRTCAGDLVLVLVSGGGSALLTLPAGGLTLDDIADTTDLLLKAGVNIQQLNAVRKHLSAVKGGRLAESLGSAGVVLTPVISDVVGDDLSVIASGPTVGDPTTYADALSILTPFRARVPGSVLEHLELGASGRIAETPKVELANQTVGVVASVRHAALGVEQAARRLGWSASIETTCLTGEAREVGKRIALEAQQMSPGEIRIYGGETTVTVSGSGKGGRNQELALAAALVLQGDPGVVLLSAGTDGVDGMSRDAGALVDGATIAVGKAMGFDALDYLNRNDSNPYLRAVGDVLTTGPTGTNVGDLVLLARSG